MGILIMFLTTHNMSYKIPNTDKKFTVTNRSDVSGNIWYTKNIDLSEEGYMKLSPRSIGIISDNSGDPVYDVDFGLVTAFGRYTTGSGYYMATNITYPFIGSVSTTSFTATQDAGAGVPLTSSNTRGAWWNDKWFITTNSADALFYKTISSGAWTSAGTIDLDGSNRSPLCLFVNKDSMCVGDDNKVYLVNNAYSVTVTLTLPTQYFVTAISYSNNRVGIITRLSPTSQNQNQDALFFVWDGANTSATGGFPIGASEGYAIAPYKGQWVILSKTGQLLYFNGGGFQELAVLPFFDKGRIWESSDMIGDTMVVDGDKIYINIGGRLSSTGIKQESFQPNYHGGIWCYDPKVGFYHMFSPSISVASQITVTSANINTTTDVFTKTAGTVPSTGSPIKYIYNATTEIGGLQAGTVYYVIYVTSSTFKLATTRANALAGTAINITSTGDTNNYFLALETRDYGQSISTSTGALAIGNTTTYTHGKLIMSTKNYNRTGTEVNYAQIIVPEFDNIGYFVTPKLESPQIEDLMQKIYSKYRPLKSNDSIKIKYKDEEVLGLPVTTPQNGVNCTWTSSTVLTTTCDISEADNYLDGNDKELELEVISGSGAGQLSKITSITESGGTYTITLTDTMEGITASDTCNIIIDNWKTLGTITSSDGPFKEFAGLGKVSKAFKVKVIMKGTNIVFEELQAINETHLKAI